MSNLETALGVAYFLFLMAIARGAVLCLYPEVRSVRMLLDGISSLAACVACSCYICHLGIL